jgi:putative ABC transport system permease protein
MKTQFFKLAFRNFRKNKPYVLINIFGLTTAIATFILISLYLKHETSWDKFNENYENIYRLEPKVHNSIEGRFQYLAQTPWPAGEKIKETYSEVQNYVSLRETWGQYLAPSKDKEPIYEEKGYYTSNRVFDIFTLPFIAGSPENALSEPNTVVLTKSLANKYFPDESALGKTLIADNKYTYKVTGIIEDPPSNFHLKPSYFISYKSFKANNGWALKENWHSFSSRVYIELRDNADFQNFSEKIKDFLNKHMTDNTESTLKLNNLGMIHIRPTFSNDILVILYLFAFSSILILFLGGINYTNLTTAYLSGRHKEMGLKKAMGAKRRTIIKEIIGESLVITGMALILAFTLAELILPTFNQIVGREITLNYADEWLFIIFLVAVSILLGVIAALQPAIKFSKYKPMEAVKGWSQSSKKSSKQRLSKVLTTFQMFISITFILFALSTYHEVQFFINKDMGFNKDNLVLTSIDKTDNVTINNWQTSQDQLTRHSAINSSSLSYHAPFHDNDAESLSWEGAMADESLIFMKNRVGYNYIDTYQMEIIEGKDFSRDRASDMESCIINETAVKSIGWENPVGKTIGGKYRVIGVVEDYHKMTPYIKIMPLILFRHSEDLSEYKYITARINPAQFKEGYNHIRKTLNKFFPDAILDLHTMEDSIKNDETIKIYRSIAETFTFFSIVAIAIAVVGLFALVAFSARQRVKEIGIKKVLGATTNQIFRNLIINYLKFFFIGGTLAIIANYLLSHANPAAYSPEISPWLIVYTLFGMLIVVLIAISTQILKTAQTNPVDSLRDE